MKDNKSLLCRSRFAFEMLSYLSRICLVSVSYLSRICLVKVSNRYRVDTVSLPCRYRVLGNYVAIPRFDTSMFSFNPLLAALKLKMPSEAFLHVTVFWALWMR